MDSDSDSSVGWINASSDSESSNNVTSIMELDNYDQDNEDNLVSNSEKKKHKKAKKRKHDDDSSVSDDRPAKRKHIKIEPESDRDKSGPDDTAHSESFNNLRIKQESADDTDEPKKKKKRKHKKSQEESYNDSTLINNSQDNDTLEITSVEDSVRKKKKKKKSKYSESEDVGDDTINNLHNGNGNEEATGNKNIKRNKVPSSTFIENDLNITNETINISAIPSTVPKKTKRISDRLKFEDDELVTTLENGYESDKEVSFSKEVKTFLKRNPNFSPLTSFAQFKTDEEDILVLKCPNEVEINNFQDVNLVLDGKSKLKVSGQTYDGIIAETNTKLPLVTYSKKNVYLKNVSILKTIVFQKRIPVPHIQDDSVITNNQSRFIPLPDTKCRHPLFGTDYKKAVKVPKVVRERLSENHLQPEAVEQETLYKNKKKKHKKEKETVERESEVDSSINVKEESDSSKKKKKKRKIKEETEAKPAKRIKLEQDPGAWESEKAIEENLFNF